MQLIGEKGMLMVIMSCSAANMRHSVTPNPSFLPVAASLQHRNIL